MHKLILVDTSVWVGHFRSGDHHLESLLTDGLVVCHPLIVGELACGNLTNRQEIISLLQSLPMAVTAEHEEVLQFISDHRLMGKGLGYVDMHLMASAILTRVPLWTNDKKLYAIAATYGLAY